MKALLNTQRLMLAAPRKGRISSCCRGLCWIPGRGIGPRVVDRYISGMLNGPAYPLLHWKLYVRRQLRYLLAAMVLIGLSLSIGTVGYMVFGHLGFTDAFLNASMILAGMGPVDAMPTAGAKWFSACYALYSGVALMTIVAAMLAPAIHRMFHKMHLDARNHATKP